MGTDLADIELTGIFHSPFIPCGIFRSIAIIQTVVLRVFIGEFHAGGRKDINTVNEIIGIDDILA